MKKNKGITLISLVVTIIVLLILAGITLNLVLREDGIFNMAKEGKEEYSKVAAKEKLELILLDFQSKKAMNEVYEEEELNKALQDQNMEVEDNLVIVDGWQFEIDRSVPKIVADLEKIPEGDKLESAIIVEEILSEETKIQISIKLKNEVETKITYFITDIETGLEVGRVENTTALSNTFSNLQEERKYEITVQTNSEHEIATKKIPVATLMNYVPLLTKNTSQIIGSPKFLERGSWESEVYEPYYAFNRNESTSACSNLGGEESIGSYIGYNFLEPVKISKVIGRVRMLSYKIQYSDDLEDWIDVAEGKLNGSDYGDYFSNDINKDIEPHQYWRLYVNGGQARPGISAMVYSLRFYGETQNDLISCIPKLTEKNSQIIGSPKFLETGSWSNEVYKPEYAFDRNEKTCASSNTIGAETIGSYIGYDFLEPVKICKVVGKIRMLGYKVQYSDDLENWANVAEGELSGSSSGDFFSNNIDKEVGAHRYWRLYTNKGQVRPDMSAMVYNLQFYKQK